MAKIKLNLKNKLPHKTGLAVGGVGCRFIDKVAPNLNPTIKNVGQMALGIILPPVMKQKENSMLTGVGDALIAVGAYKLGEKIPGLAGVDDIDGSIGETGYVIDEDYNMNGTDEISGVDDLNDSIGELTDEDLD